MGAKGGLTGIGVGLGVCVLALAVAAQQLTAMTYLQGGAGSQACQEGDTRPSDSVAQGGVTTVAEDEIPEEMLEIYQDVAEAWGMDWALLAAVGYKESTHNTNRSVDTENSAGALGPMQFIPSAWEHHGLYYGDKTGKEGKPPLKERLDPQHSVWSAAHKLTDQDVNSNPEQALIRYYGADVDGYVSSAMAKADQYRDGDFTSGSGGPVVVTVDDCPDEGTGFPGQAPDYSAVELSGQTHLEPCPIENEPFGAGPITPLTCAAHRTIVDNFRPILNSGGNCKRSGTSGEHPLGRACDYMTDAGGIYSTGKQEKNGDSITQYAMDHWDTLGVKYIIWRQSIWTPRQTVCGQGTRGSYNNLGHDEGQWCLMGDRGSITENHYDHVHVSFIE